MCLKRQPHSQALAAAIAKPGNEASHVLQRQPHSQALAAAIAKPGNEASHVLQRQSGCDRLQLQSRSLGMRPVCAAKAVRL